MSVTRRDFLRGASVLAGAAAFGPVAGRAGTGWAEGVEINPLAKNRRRLVLIDLCGGNDGLNTVVPRTGALRAGYEAVRDKTRIPAPLESLGPANGAGDTVGLHPALATLKALAADGRLAVVQGVYYTDKLAKQDLSHFTSADIWQSGDPVNTPQSGWLGRHLDRTGVADGELRALAIGSGLPLALTGAQQRGAQLLSLPPAFPDGRTAATHAIHLAYRSYGGHPDTNPLRARYGDDCQRAVDLVEDPTVRAITAPRAPSTGWPAVFNGMLGARELLTADLGVEIVTIKHTGFDTHAHQTEYHARLLRELDEAIEAFYFGTKGGVPLYRGGVAYGPLDPFIAERTVVMTFSEFGRRIGENGDGTDHGAAAPLFLVGPPATTAKRVNGGVFGDHPPLTTGAATRNNLQQTTDFRAVYQDVLKNWLAQDEDGARKDGGDDSFGATAQLGLFT